MSTHIERGSLVPLRRELDALRSHWISFLILGIGLIVLGTLAIGSAVLATLATVFTFGLILLGAGLGQAIGAFWARGWSGFFQTLFIAAFYLITGLIFVRDVGGVALAMSMVLAALLMVGGIYRIIGSIALMFPYWGLTLVGGVIDILLGVCIWIGWPLAGLWVIGVFVGMHLIVNGAFWTTLALRLRRIPRLQG